ncbi:MAG TPA: hypothetical protein DCM68_01805 [Verrucomicrobia bacterium]|nr:hypothetical protein [Verrucomicrobiota bacterium]
MKVLLVVAAVWPAAGGHADTDAGRLAFPDNQVLPQISPHPARADAEPLDLFGKVSTVAKDLRGPDGIARDLESGDIYVSEENATAIVRIKPNGSRQVLFDGSTPLYEEGPTIRKKAPGLRSPEGLALDGKGMLYVVEDVPGGRLISFNLKEQSRPYGMVVPIPLENSRYAWESVAVGPSGELLVAGSTMEAFISEREKEGLFGLFRGAILYRDAQGGWWMPQNDAMASYSAACFSPDGTYAFFACEISGDVGCLDLRTRQLRTFHARQSLHSPEGLCALPNGSALVAEESGKIYRLDPTTDTMQLLYDHPGTIESVQWDAAHRRLLVTDDQEGRLMALELKAGTDFRPPGGTIGDIRFEDQSTPVEMIPDQCPGYLAKVLKLAGYDSDRKEDSASFRMFAKKYCLVAIDAEADLVRNHKPVEDPIQQIQFMIVAPYLIGFQEGELIWSSSGFTVVKESGQVVKTGLVKRQIIHGDLLEARFTPIGGQTIALPMPFSARVNMDGFVSVNFMGMGVTPDFYLVLDTAEPNQSIMVVIQPDGFVQQYTIRLPPNRDRSHWVIALERKEPDVWRRLSAKP